MTKSHRESPIKRTYPNGRVRWLARYTGPDGRRRSAGTYKLKSEAQDAIDAAYDDLERRAPETVGEYAAGWSERRPRSARTNATNQHRLGRVLDVRVEGVALRDWPLRELRRRHALELVDHMLREQHRAPSGVVNILRSLSTMAEDAITDEIAEVNPFRGVKVRANDPRATKTRRPVRVFSFEQMHRFAAAAADAPERSGGAAYAPVARAIVRTPADTGMRLGELLALRRQDLDLREQLFRIQRTAHEGQIMEGTKRDRLRSASTGGRIVPCPPGLLALLREMPVRIDTELLFPTPHGRLWRERNFYRDIWYPTQRASGLDTRPHEMRHSYITHLRAAGIDDADLAEITGHTIETMLGTYTHPLGRSYDRVRDVIG